MKTKQHIILYLLALPWNLTIGWPMVLIVRALWGENLAWESPPAPMAGGPVLTCSFRASSWPARTWYSKWGGTTAGHAIIYNAGEQTPGGWSHVQKHEHVHVEQFEGACVSGFILGLLAFVPVISLGHPEAAVGLWLGIWWAGYMLMGIGNWIAAWLRGEDPYRGSAHEESAYSQAEQG
jgi:hypothetical protein